MSVRLVTRAQCFAVRAFVAASAVCLAVPSHAVTDKRAVQGATDSLGPAIPEPSSIFLFVAGVAIVGYGVHRRRRRSQ
jgi:hypothetical protein